MNKVKIIALGLIVLLLLIVVFQNTQETTVTLLLARVTMPLAMLLTIILAGGFVSGLATALVLRSTRNTPPKP